MLQRSANFMMLGRSSGSLDLVESCIMCIHLSLNVPELSLDVRLGLGDPRLEIFEELIVLVQKCFLTGHRFCLTAYSRLRRDDPRPKAQLVVISICICRSRASPLPPGGGLTCVSRCTPGSPCFSGGNLR